MKITYVPGPEEPSETVAYSRKWQANVPVEIDERAGYEIEESHREDRPDGTYRLIPRKRRVTIIEMATGNPTFQVEGKPRRGRPPKPRPDQIPNAAEEHGNMPAGRMIDAEYALDHGMTHEAEET